jgi:peptide/nickel transport system substrate-binding protein
VAGHETARGRGIPRRDRKAGGVRRAAATIVASAAAVLAAGCSSPARHAPVDHRPRGGTATIADLAGSGPNWIFPYGSVANYSLANYQDFIDLMYRPLYMFGGDNESVTVNYALSPARAPVYRDGGRSVSITLKGWSWSDGEKVDAQDVVFWLNMDEAEKLNFAGYANGGIPDDLLSYRAVNARTVVLRFTRPFSSTWFTYNELAQITPMPLAWDITRAGADPGSGGCVRDSAADHWSRCKAVYRYLTALSSAHQGRWTSPSEPWSVTDGPWRLSSFRICCETTLVPNLRYSGPLKPALTQIKFVTYDSTGAILDALKAGRADVAVIPPVALPAKPVGRTLPSVNPAGKGYTLEPAYDWGINYYTLDYAYHRDAAIFGQLYFRQAMQELTDQDALARQADRGYATPTSAGVPNEPLTRWVSSQMAANHGAGPYPYDPARAEALLADHGWSVIRGTLTCEQPGADAGHCGPGVARGETADLGAVADWSAVAGPGALTPIIRSDLAAAGIHITVFWPGGLLGPAPCTAPHCATAMMYLEGWTFNGPGYEPSGEPLFQTGAPWNYGLYSSPVMDSLIKAVQTSDSLGTFHAYANYTATQLPVIWLPAPYSVAAVNRNLRGVTQSPIGSFYPEYWYFARR